MDEVTPSDDEVGGVVDVNVSAGGEVVVDEGTTDDSDVDVGGAEVVDVGGSDVVTSDEVGGSMVMADMVQSGPYY